MEAGVTNIDRENLGFISQPPGDRSCFVFVLQRASWSQQAQSDTSDRCVNT